jgi:hypothetical protein
MAKPIRLSGHAREQLTRRGVSEYEVVETIQTSKWDITELNRLQCRKDFPFDGLWNGKPYKSKQVRPIFVEESNEIVVITVYSYYF